MIFLCVLRVSVVNFLRIIFFPHRARKLGLFGTRCKEGGLSAGSLPGSSRREPEQTS
jgi:hypothetical protein